MSEQPESVQNARDAARSYDDPHSDAQSSLDGTAGPEGSDPVDSMATEVREPDEADNPRPGEQTSDNGR